MASSVFIDFNINDLRKRSTYKNHKRVNDFLYINIRIKCHPTRGRYRNILEEIMLSVNEHFPSSNLILQQDNSPVYTCRYVKIWLVENSINRFDVYLQEVGEEI